jgi:predicted ATPase/transcriptional regulator with XRE-family HTH domain
MAERAQGPDVDRMRTVTGSPEPAARLPVSTLRPHWGTLLRALREARGVTLDGWGARLGVSRKTVQRWERGERVPDPGAEATLLAYCQEQGLFRLYDRGPLAGFSLTAELLRDLLTEARLEPRNVETHAALSPGSALPGTVGHDRVPHTDTLPAQITSFVGREEELAAVRRVQAGTRLLTLIGAGGCGKTRLALQLAGELPWAYPHGVWFVDLAPLADPTLAPQAVAATLQISITGQQPVIDSVTAALEARHLLIILDNCEHLLPACAVLAETLLRACPHLEILATSREVLGIGGETVWRVPPLSLPGGASEAAAGDAVQLFVERARLRWPELALTPDAAAAVASICRRLDGMPLAIELAAARIDVLSMAQIAERLDDRFRLLTGGGRTAVPRHQTLRAAMDWSYDLLTGPEQALLRALAVFAGGWTLEAAEAIGPGAGCDTVEVLDLLTALVAKSLVVRGDGAGEPRYRLLETVRAYAREKLVAAGDDERTAIHRRHAAYLLALAETAEPGLRGPEQAAWFARVEVEHDNLRSALGWAAEAGTGEATTGLRLAGALSWFWYIRGHFGEGRRWLERFLIAGAGTPPALRAKALQGAARLATPLGDTSAVRVFSEQALVLWQELGDWPEYARTLHNLGNLIYQWEAGYDTGRALMEEALAIGRRHTSAEGVIGHCLSHLGFIAYLRGDVVAARGLLEESLAIQRSRADMDGIAMALSMLGRVARAEGDVAGARALLAEALKLRSQFVGPWGVAFPLAGIAELALNGHPAFTARLLGALEAMDALRGGLPVHYQVARAAMTDAAQSALGDTEFAAAWAAGRALPPAQVVAEALAFVTTDAPSQNSSGQGSDSRF